MEAQQIRESVIAGTWYPGTADRLRQEIDRYLKAVPEQHIEGNLIALISPHAGYRYSGQVAAYGYKLLAERKFATVVIIAPSHRAYFPGVSVYDRGGYRTPLGIVPLDQDLIRALEGREPRIRYVPEAHAQEHSLEIQLPFLQVVLADFKLVPLVMGDQSFATCQWLAEALADCIAGKSILVVASSDLSHFHPYEQAKKLDSVVLEKVNGFDARGLSDSLAEHQCEACGGGPMVTAMLLARQLGANKSRVLHYANSGDVTGDRSSVVGYMAAAFWANPGKDSKQGRSDKKVGVDLGLSPEEKALLHKIARESIEAHCLNKAMPNLRVDSPKLNEHMGAFVTLHKHGKLRGCIGHIRGQQPLIETVSEMAIAAAFQDPRFPAVTREELPELEIEISVLTPLKRIHNVEVYAGTATQVCCCRRWLQSGAGTGRRFSSTPARKLI